MLALYPHAFLPPLVESVAAVRAWEGRQTDRAVRGIALAAPPASCPSLL